MLTKIRTIIALMAIGCSFVAQAYAQEAASGTSQQVTAVELKAQLHQIEAKIEQLDKIEQLGTLEQETRNFSTVTEYFCSQLSNEGVPKNEVSAHCGHEYVDLGIYDSEGKPVYWATCNVGAKTPEEFGDYYAWGETEPHYAPFHSQDEKCTAWREYPDRTINGYNWDSYKYCNDVNVNLTKYCYQQANGYHGYTDNKTILDAEDDAAHGNWGGDWRMPTQQEWEQLISQCVWTWMETPSGVSGYKVEGNGNFIFLPGAGWNCSGWHGYNGQGSYWSSSLYIFSNTDSASGSTSTSLDTLYAWYLSFDSKTSTRKYTSRFMGFSVRPVCQ